MEISPKYKMFMVEYLKTSNITQSAIKAGFAPQYADKEGKLILNRAIKYHTQALLDKSSNNEITSEEAKKDLCDLLGLTSDNVMNRLKDIALQDRDYSSALKVLAPVSKSIGYDMSTEDNKEVTQPVLNIGVIQTQEGKTTPNIKDIDIKDIKDKT